TVLFKDSESFVHAKMLIGVCGGPSTLLRVVCFLPPNSRLGICAGKHSVAEYLVQNHQFLRLHLPSKSPTLPSTAAEDIERLRPTVTDEKGTRGLSVPDIDALLDFRSEERRVGKECRCRGGPEE